MTRTVHLQISVDPEKKSKLQELLKKRGQGVSWYVRELIRKDSNISL